MEVFKVALVLLLSVGFGAANFHCKTKVEGGTAFPAPVCFIQQCMNTMMSQINVELGAACQYLGLAMYYGQNHVNRPGMAKFSFEAADEERGHAKAVMNYLEMRGIDNTSPKFECKMTLHTESDLLHTLEKINNMEIEVTKSLNDLAKRCSDDKHAEDFVTSQMLDEQHKGIRKIQAYIRTLRNLRGDAKSEVEIAVAVADHIFDQKLLHGKIL